MIRTQKMVMLIRWFTEGASVLCVCQLTACLFIVTAPSASYTGIQISLFVSCVLSQPHATSVIVTFSHTPRCFFVNPSVNQAAPLNFPHCALFLSLIHIPLLLSRKSTCQHFSCFLVVLVV